MTAPPYPVVVLGGGPAGCAVALALRRSGVDGVLIVEAGDYGAPRVGESIPPDAHVLLERLGLWKEFLGEGHEPCLGSCSLWGGEVPGYNDFLFNPHGNGWHLDRRRFEAFLARRAVAAGARLWTGTRCEGAARREDGGFELRLATAEGPRTVHARLVVDATGNRCQFARWMGAARRVHDRLSYVAAFLELPAGAEMSRLTLLEAVEYGWWYAARLPDCRVAVAVASDPEIVKAEALHRKDRWLARLRETRLLSGELAGCRFPPADLLRRTALSFVLDKVCGDGWLAMGDAASAYDPISSQGLYKALAEGLQAAEVLAARLAGGGEEASADYGAAVAARFEDYLKNRNYFYEIERRWPSAPFWERRRARTGRSALL